MLTYTLLYFLCSGLADKFSRLALSASLEYFKYCAGKNLPTMLMEAQLDYFGAHAYDLKSEDTGKVKRGKSLGNYMYM